MSVNIDYFSLSTVAKGMGEVLDGGEAAADEGLCWSVDPYPLTAAPAASPGPPAGMGAEEEGSWLTTGSWLSSSSPCRSSQSGWSPSISLGAHFPQQQQQQQHRQQEKQHPLRKKQQHAKILNQTEFSIFKSLSTLSFSVPICSVT